MREEEERRQEQQRREEARIAREREEMRRLKEREAEKAKEKQVDQSKVKPLVLSRPPPLSVSPFFKNYLCCGAAPIWRLRQSGPGKESRKTTESRHNQFRFLQTSSCYRVIYSGLQLSVWVNVNHNKSLVETRNAPDTGLKNRLI